MFKFTKLFWHNSKSQRKTLLLANFVNFLLMAVILMLIFIPFQQLIQMASISMMMGQRSIQNIILTMIGFIVLTLIIFVFLIYPLFTGSIRTFYHAIHDHTSVKFTDIFKSFTGGRWLKAVKLGLFVTLCLVLMSAINTLVSMGLKSLLSTLILSLRDLSLSNGTLQTIILIGFVIISIISSIIIWFVCIFVTNMTVAYVEEPKRPLKELIKLGWSGIRNKQKTFLPFFIGLLILNFILILFALPILQLLSNLVSQLSLETLNIIKLITVIVYFLLRFFVYFFIIGTIVQYFVRRGQKQEKQVK